MTVEDNVFIGHGEAFTKDTYPRATAASGELQTESDWKMEPTFVKKGASIGSEAMILSKVTIGENEVVGACSVITRDAAPSTIVVGNPARVLRRVEGLG